MVEELRNLGMDEEEVWPGLPLAGRTLWNASLFPAVDVKTAWNCVRWLLGVDSCFSVTEWRALEKLSLATSAQFDDTSGAPVSYARRMEADWVSGALALADSGADVRPMLAYSRTLRDLTEVARGLHHLALRHEAKAPTEAASRYFQSGMFLDRAGLTADAVVARTAAFRNVEHAVHCGIPNRDADFQPARRWARPRITQAVQAPAPGLAAARAHS